jgi:hypothetical protein
LLADHSILLLPDLLLQLQRRLQRDLSRAIGPEVRHADKAFTDTWRWDLETAREEILTSALDIREAGDDDLDALDDELGER